MDRTSNRLFLFKHRKNILWRLSMDQLFLLKRRRSMLRWKCTSVPVFKLITAIQLPMQHISGTCMRRVCVLRVCVVLVQVVTLVHLGCIRKPTGNHAIRPDKYMSFFKCAIF